MNILWGQTKKAIAAPIEIYHEAFAIARNYEAAEFTDQHIRNFLELISASRDHPDEASMMNSIRDKLLPFFFINSEDTIANASKRLPERTDGGASAYVFLNNTHMRMPILLLEGKYDLGNGGDPILQAVVAYCKRLCEDCSGGIFAARDQPCFLMAVASSWVFLYGAIIEDMGTVHVDDLWSMNLKHTSNTTIMNRNTQKLVALSNAQRILNDGLSSIKSKDDTGVLRPFPISGLTYTRKCTPENPLVYNGMYNHSGASTAVVVKFTPAPYGMHVQNCLADVGLAPRVLHTTQVWGSDWYATIMEEVTDAMTLRSFLCGDLCSTTVGRLQDQLRLVVATLQKHDCVHGDLHLDNILVKRGSDGSAGGDGGIQVLAVDFEWAGQAGQVRFPSFVPDLGFVPITLQHDRESLENIMKAIKVAVEAAEAQDRVKAMLLE